MSGKDRSECIEHDGLVQESGSDHVVVRISSASACSGCHEQGSCMLTGTEEKIVDISGNYNVSPGDKVTVVMMQSAGFAALFLGYILPLVLILAALIVLTAASVPELTAGLVAIAVLVPYYVALWIFRKKIGRKFTFTIKA